MVRREEQQISLADALVYERVSGNKVLYQCSKIISDVSWIPAFAGMTVHLAYEGHPSESWDPDGRLFSSTPI